MCEAFRLIAISLLKGFCDSLSNRLLFGDELIQKIGVQAFVSCKALQATRYVYALNLGNGQFVSFMGGPAPPAFPCSGPTGKGGEECTGINGFRNLVLPA